MMMQIDSDSKTSLNLYLLHALHHWVYKWEASILGIMTHSVIFDKPDKFQRVKRRQVCVSLCHPFLHISRVWGGFYLFIRAGLIQTNFCVIIQSSPTSFTVINKISDGYLVNEGKTQRRTKMGSSQAKKRKKKIRKKSSRTAGSFHRGPNMSQSRNPNRC